MRINPPVPAQDSEYKMSKILGNPRENTLGYVAVLSSTCSAYRILRYRTIVKASDRCRSISKVMRATALTWRGPNGLMVSIFYSAMLGLTFHCEHVSDRGLCTPCSPFSA